MGQTLYPTYKLMNQERICGQFIGLLAACFEYKTGIVFEASERQTGKKHVRVPTWYRN